ncbi:MAG: hypothetical protein NVS1B13_09040 [Flavisolibacter sp.]
MLPEGWIGKKFYQAVLVLGTKEIIRLSVEVKIFISNPTCEKVSPAFPGTQGIGIIVHPDQANQEGKLHWA